MCPRVIHRDEAIAARIDREDRLARFNVDFSLNHSERGGYFFEKSLDNGNGKLYNTFDDFKRVALQQACSVLVKPRNNDSRPFF